MQILDSELEVEKLINEHEMSILYFMGTDCGACFAIKDKVEMMMRDYPKIEIGEISGEKHSDIAAKYGVFSLPLMIVYVDKKETLRVGRNISMLDFEKDINRYYRLIFNE